MAKCHTVDYMYEAFIEIRSNSTKQKQKVKG